MKAGRPTLMAQMPNRKGNISATTPNRTTGVTAQTGSNKMGVSQPKGNQGAPSATGIVHGGNGKYKVSIAKPEPRYEQNCGYLKNSSYKG